MLGGGLAAGVEGGPVGDVLRHEGRLAAPVAEDSTVPDRQAPPNQAQEAVEAVMEPLQLLHLAPGLKRKKKKRRV